MKLLIRGLLTCLIFACGSDVTVAPSDLDRLHEDDGGRKQVLVDVLDNDGERVEFWDVGTGEESEILTTTLGSETTGMLLARVSQEATPAEIWRNITGRDDIPEALLRDHVRTRALYDLPTDLLDVDLRPAHSVAQDGVVRKLTVSGWAQLFPISGTTCWEGIRVGGVTTTGNAQPGFFCSEPPFASNNVGFRSGLNVLLGNQASDASCANNRKTKEAIRNGVHFKTSSNGKPRHLVTCYRSSDSNWPCLPPVTIMEKQFHGSDYGKTSSDHALLTRVHLYDINGSFSTTSEFDKWEMGAAVKLLARPVAFGSPNTCSPLP